ncbi:MAG: GGDEF domain-containing protein [Gammaproteobacteria bacterium]|nr:GGDEF domain-containing protein [Gammaproteobacteria bacterium]
MKNMPEDIAARLKTCTSFPSPPPIALQVIELAQNPETDLGTVANTISADPALTSKVMRIANSALYARRRQSSNLRQALIVLGLNATLTLALSFTLVATIDEDPEKGLDLDAYWRRALLAATWGKLLASESGRRDPEEIFLAALLQDIGMLAVHKIAPEVYDEISPFQMAHLELAEYEKSQLKVDHRMIGAWLLKEWRLPDHIVRAVKYSHDIAGNGVEAEFRGFARIVSICSELADVWLLKPDQNAMQRVGKEVSRHLGILPNRLAEMFETIGQQVPVTQGIFEMDIFDGSQLQEISDTAREILTIRNLHAIQDQADLRKRATKLESENEELKDESHRDGLTGVHNRRGFEARLDKEFEMSSVHHWPLSMIFVDVDRFKQINDNHGHQTGDAMLQEVGTLLADNVREQDLVARYGGDEFVLLLPGSDDQEVEAVAKRLVDTARAKSVRDGNGNDVSITLSIGVATQGDQTRFESTKEFLAAADEALYHSKRNGRDRATTYVSIKAA